MPVVRILVGIVVGLSAIYILNPIFSIHVAFGDRMLLALITAILIVLSLGLLRPSMLDTSKRLIGLLFFAALTLGFVLRVQEMRDITHFYGPTFRQSPLYMLALLLTLGTWCLLYAFRGPVFLASLTDNALKKFMKLLTRGEYFEEAEILLAIHENVVEIQWPQKPIITIAKQDIIGVAVETNGRGPTAPDVIWHLGSKNGVTSIPNGASGIDDLVQLLQTLSGFRNDRLIEAMGCTEKCTFILWDELGRHL